MKSRIVVAFLMPLCFSSVAVAANPNQAQFNVKITVAAGCTLTSSGDIDFSSVVGTAAQPANAVTNLTATCTSSTPYTITFLGLYDSDPTTKVMKGTTGNTDTLTYQLVDTTSGTTVYGNDSDHAFSGTGTGSAQTVSIAAKLLNWSSKAVKPDAYSDTVTATITY